MKNFLMENETIDLSSTFVWEVKVVICNTVNQKCQTVCFLINTAELLLLKQQILVM